MFMHCEYLINLNLSNWDTKSLTKVYYYDGWTNFGMFDSCYALQELNLSNWDISNIKSLRQLFNKCRALKKLDLSNWDFTNVEEFLYTFDNCNMLENIKISNANNVNIISQYLPDRTTSTTGKIIIINNKTGLDTSTLLSKNWNIV